MFNTGSKLKNDTANRFCFRLIILSSTSVIGIVAFLSLWIFASQIEAKSILTIPPMHSGQEMLFLPAVFHNYYPPQWEHVGLSGRVTDIYLDTQNPNHAYVSVFFDGLYESVDAGATWVRHEQLTLTGRLYAVESDLLTPDGLFLAAWGGYTLYYSESGQPPWQPVSGWHNLFPLLYSLQVHPLTPTIMFAGAGSWEGNGGKIYKTENWGNSWFATSPEHVNALTFAIDPFLPQIIYAGSEHGGVWKSSDNGDQWVEMSEGLPDEARNVSSIFPHPDIPLQIYAATETGVYISYDGAENWQPLLEGIDANALLANPDDASTLYLGTENGILISNDSGQNWIQFGSCGVGMEIRNLTLLPNGDLWAGTGDELFSGDGVWLCAFN